MEFDELVIEIDETNHDDFLESEIGVLNFISDWHMNCLMVLPIMEDIAREFKEKHDGICFGKVNIDEYVDIARKHKISRVPTVIILRNGQPLHRMESSIHEDDIREKLSALLEI